MTKKFLILFCVMLMIVLSACNSSPKTNISDPIQNDFKGNVKGDTTEEVKTISLISGQGHKAEYDEASYDVLMKASFPSVMLYYEDENNFPKLGVALENVYTNAREEAAPYFEENRAYAKDLYDELGDDFSAFELSTAASVRRADTKVTSLLFTKCEYSGGAHGNSFCYGETYDTQTGMMIGLYDIVADYNPMYDAISEQLDSFYGDIWSGNASDVKEIIEQGDTFSWTLDYNGITFYFMPYSLIKTAPGVQIVTVSHEEYPGILNPEFISVPSSYGIELTSDTAFYYDVTGDGKVDEIIFSYYPSDMGEQGCISIYINGKPYDTESYFFDADATFVHTADGRNYICAELLRDNDYRETVCYDIKDGVQSVGSIDGSLRMIYHEGGELLITHDVLTNPESFRLQSITQHLSTATGYKEYRIGDDGSFISDEDYFMFDEETAHIFTLLQDVSVDEYDISNSSIGKTKTLTTGSEVVYIGTDGERYALLNTIDGMFRIDTDGINIYEAFDGISFAG